MPREAGFRPCTRDCALESCVTDGCWLEQARIRAPLDALVRRLVEAVAAHAADCADPGCAHVAHRTTRAA